MACWRWAVMAALIVCACGAPSIAQEQVERTLTGPIVIRFDQPLDRLAVPRSQFGIYRELEPESKQFVAEDWQTAVDDPAGPRFPHLRIKFTVNDGYNGFWIRCAPPRRSADWSEYQDGSLMLRVVAAPDEWKSELKDDVLTANRVTRLHDEQARQVRERGWCDLALPLSDFAKQGVRLDRLRELVFTFESDRLPEGKRSSQLSIAQIGLSHGTEFEDDSDAILEDLNRRVFRWFRDCTHPETGLVLDRSLNRYGSRPDPKQPAMCSIASVGYMLSMLPEWERLKYMTRDEAASQAERTLRSCFERCVHHEGALYHFCDISTCQPWRDSEVGLLDHAILLNGAMTASVAYRGLVQQLADQLIERTNWRAFLLPAGNRGKPLMSFGWSPEKGVLPSTADVRSSEIAMMIFLAVGSPKPVSDEMWYNTTVVRQRVMDHEVLNPEHPLFTSVYGLNWHDLEGKVDREGVDLFANARAAALLNRDFCRTQGLQDATYRLENGGFFGISAGDSPNGYGAFSPTPGNSDGIVWPSCALASWPWIESELKQDLPRWRNSSAWIHACGPYGIGPFRLGERPWQCNEIIGIDQGSFACSLANARNRTIWKLWKQHPVAVAAYDRIGIRDK